MSGPQAGKDVERAVEILRAGGVVGLPTETVYGLGADASNPEAVQRVFRIKGRPADHPLIVHIFDSWAARRWAAHWPSEADALSKAFWPGPLTIVVEGSENVIGEVTGGRTTVALRCPSHPMMHEVLRRFGGGVAAPSANRFGKVSPTTAQHVLDDLGAEVDYVLDGGPCEIGVESTIVDCTVNPPQILRPGGVSEDDIARTLGAVAPASGPSRASGMMESHYAPRCRVHPVESIDEARLGVAGLSSQGCCPGATRVLDASIDPVEFASQMYGLLRQCDAAGVEDVFVVLPRSSGIGAAIRDRIAKAAART